MANKMTIEAARTIGKFANNFLRSRVKLFHDVAAIYRPRISRHGEKLIELMKEKAEAASKTELARKMRVAKGYAIVEMSPPKFYEISQIRAEFKVAQEFMKSGAWKQLTVKQATLLALVSLEVIFWFYLGETLGKMSFVGYKV